MLELVTLLHIGGVVLIIILSTIGGGLGGGHATKAALEAINIQPRAKAEIVRALLIGLALIETAAVLALIIIFMLLFQVKAQTIPEAIAAMGIAAAIGITSLVVGIVSSWPIQKAVHSIARQPFFGQRILNLMLITLSLIQTAIIFGFLIALLISLQLSSIHHISHAITLCVAGFTLALGSIGPTIGLAQFAQIACEKISINRKAYQTVLPFVFMSEAIIETPLIFVFLVCLIMVLKAPATPDTLITIAKMCGAGLCISIGTCSPGLNSSKTSAAACTQIVKNPSNYAILSQTSMFGQGLIDAAAIYALLISLFMLFVP
jgi:F-type H+-transporting ATPase subunit c